MILLLRWAIDEDLFHAHSLYLGHMGQDFCRLRQSEVEVSFFILRHNYLLSVSLLQCLHGILYFGVYCFFSGTFYSVYSISFFAVPYSLPV
jgi:hypothetical protein